MRKISICIPTYNRFEMTVECFDQVLHDERISEIIVSDDCSTDGSYELLVKHFKNEPKVKLHQNKQNMDCYFNKHRAIELASNDWCCLWDSDNIFGADYIDCLYKYNWDDSVILTPSFAKPHFDFRDYEGALIMDVNVGNYVDLPMFETMLNACNYFVNRRNYLEVWDDSVNPVTSDSIYMAYKWLESGESIFVVPNLMYQHRVHSGSHYQNKNHLTPKGLHENILQKLRELK